MKKLVLIALMAIFSLGSFAASPKLIKAPNASFLIKKELKVQAPETTSSVHLTGTMTSSCGEVWDFTYDCYSDCSFGGTVSNLADMQRGINAACGTSTTELSFSW